MSQHLYEISKDLSELQQKIEESENVDESLSQALTDTLQGVQLSFEDKAQQVVHVIRNTTSTVDAIQAEIDRLTKKKKSIAKKEEWLRDYLRENMERTGISKIECPLFKITLAKPTKTVQIEDEDSLPEDLYEIEVKKKPNKAEIKKALDAGKDVPGARFVESARRLIIK